MTSPRPRVVELPVRRPVRPRRALANLAAVRTAPRAWRLARLAVARRFVRAGAALRSPAARRCRRVLAHVLRAAVVAWCLPWIVLVVIPAAPLLFLAVALDGQVTHYLEEPDDLLADGGDPCRHCERR